MSATARLAAPKTAYAFPGQGIQHRHGNGGPLPVPRRPVRCGIGPTRSPATRWASRCCMWCVTTHQPDRRGVHYQHPEGVLYLTQFTQVAMATVAAAQVAEMREQGAFVEGAIACGHSVGEYTALACVTNVYELEALLEVVFQRGSKMRHRPA